MRKIAIACSKGGTGKTTSTANLAAGLAAKGKRVLVVDCDPQGHCGIVFGVTPGDDSLAELLTGRTDLASCIVPLRPGIDGILSDSRLEVAARELAGRSFREKTLRRVLAEVSGYDFILMDNAPGMTLLTQNSLLFADELMIPVSMEFLALAGLGDLLKEIAAAREAGEHAAVLHSIVPTFYDKRVTRSKQVLGALQERFGGMVTQPIRVSTRISEACACQRTVFEFDAPAGKEDYTALSEVILSGE